MKKVAITLALLPFLLFTGGELNKNETSKDKGLSRVISQEENSTWNRYKKIRASKYFQNLPECECPSKFNYNDSIQEKTSKYLDLYLVMLKSADSFYETGNKKDALIALSCGQEAATICPNNSYTELIVDKSEELINELDN